MFSIVIFSLIFFFGRCQWKPCDNVETTATLTSFFIENCQQDKCVFKPNGILKGKAIFVPKGNSTSMKVSMSAKVFGTVSIEFPNLNHDGCSYQDVKCPLTANVSTTFSMDLKIPNVFFTVIYCNSLNIFIL
uniref:Mite group 2 allergen Pso o 2 (Trinotate prediction) n=1 Tax=Henneguya salminicola TaxID=69463 RepID=A0A6G3MJM1_HENSL